MPDTLILSIDQGTTSSRAILFQKDGSSVFTSQREFTQHFPQSGWVEHDPEEIWQSVVDVCSEAVEFASREGFSIAAAGITNQRETTVVWDRHSGKAVHNAIVWQDRRTAAYCNELKESGYEPTFTAKTGLLLDPYFSATKIRWILDNVDGARERANSGDLLFGTIDSFLLWRMTHGEVHTTDATNASRTLAYNIHTGEWDDELLTILDIPKTMLPGVQNSSDHFGKIASDIFGDGILVCGVAGDQQAATFGQICLEPGTIKSTYGTGCFVLLNTGKEALSSENRLLTTVAYQLNGETTYAIEGSIFVAGAAVQWLRDGLGVIKSAEETENMVKGLTSNQGVYLVPAFTGLGAPHWNPDARGALFGLTRDTGVEQIVRATLESVAFQTYDLFKAMAEDGVTPTKVRVDGGMVNNNWVCQFLANILNIPVQRPVQTETTALGAAYLAGLHCGIYKSHEDLAANWLLDQEFTPNIDADERDQLIAAWRKAVDGVQHQTT
ncbi:glycerol kinase [Chromatiales bacterium (ex Bugula neritina AB1)]|nr:glycerol kinase [Chromatiales bacterium (ex Bugula neritina AB1)]